MVFLLSLCMCVDQCVDWYFFLFLSFSFPRGFEQPTLFPTSSIFRVLHSGTHVSPEELDPSWKCSVEVVLRVEEGDLGRVKETDGRAASSKSRVNVPAEEMRWV